MNASFRPLGLLAAAALVAACFVAPIPVRADTAADISNLLTNGLADAPSDFTAIRGNPRPKETDEYWSTDSFGNFQRCMVIDMPSLSSIMSGGDSSDQSALECTSPRLAMSQKAMYAWLKAIIGKDVPAGYTLKMYPAKKPGLRGSLEWTSGPTTIQAIVSGNADALNHDYKHSFFYLSIEHEHPTSDGSN